MRDLRDLCLAAEIELVAGAVRERHIGRMARHERKRHARPSRPCMGSAELSFTRKAKWP